MGPLITLTTDFGAGSGYPAQMKAVILGAVPGATIVDLSHDVPPFDVLAGAMLLEACVPWFPDDTVHCAVIDPGVGTARRPLVVVDGAGRRLVGPDNGLFTPFLDERAKAIEIAKPVGTPRRRSATFHGRDLFAPVAAWLAQGGQPATLGPMVKDPLRLLWPSANRAGNVVHGECLTSDPFGNITTSIRECDLAGETVLTVYVGGHPARWAKTFGEGGPGELLALLGSSGRVEVAMREASAVRVRGIVRRTPVVVVLRGSDP